MSNPSIKLFCAIALLTSSGIAPAAQAEDQASLQVSVSGLRNTDGKVWFCLWKEGRAKNFPNCDKHKPFAKLSAPANAPVAVFGNVQPGAYAISIYHDEKGNGALAVNFAGIPKSAVGTSNNPALGMRSRPSFNKSRFTVPGKTTFSVEAKYVF
jgi:uncharacterized protein (DUF2141 family)